MRRDLRGLRQDYATDNGRESATGSDSVVEERGSLMSGQKLTAILCVDARRMIQWTCALGSREWTAIFSVLASI